MYKDIAKGLELFDIKYPETLVPVHKIRIIILGLLGVILLGKLMILTGIYLKLMKNPIHNIHLVHFG